MARMLNRTSSWISNKYNSAKYKLGNVRDNVMNSYNQWNDERLSIKQQRGDQLNDLDLQIEDIKALKLEQDEEERRLEPLLRRKEDLNPFRTATKRVLGTGAHKTAAGLAFLVGAGGGFLRKKATAPTSFHEPDKGVKRSIDLLIVLSFLFHFIFFVYLPIEDPWLKLIINILFALTVYFLLVPLEERADAFRELFFVVVLYLGWEIIFSLLLPMFSGGAMFIRDIMLNPLFTPWWFYYAVFIRSRQRTPLSRVLTVLIIALWVVFAISSIPSINAPILDNIKGVTMSPSHVDTAKEFLAKNKEFWVNNVWKRILDLFSGSKNWWHQRIELASGGDYYAGRIEQTKNEPLGVTINEVKSSDYEFEADEKIVVYGLVKARTLDDGIYITPGCYLGYKTSYTDKTLPGLAGPVGKYLVFDMDEQDIDCTFPPTPEVQEFLKTSKKITLTAQFNFETMAYLKTYFMYEDRLRNIVRQGLDPLDEFGVKDKKPVAVFTNGPVMLGIGTKKPPHSVVNTMIGDVSTSDDNLMRIGFTVDNNYGWKGKIKRINQLVIEVPSSITLDPVLSTCSHDFMPYTVEECKNDYITYKSKPFIECAEQNFDMFDLYDETTMLNAKQNPTVQDCVRLACENELNGFNAYQLNVNSAGKSLEDIDNYKTFSCKFKIENPSDLMGTAPVSTKYIRARVRYDYEIEASTSVRVKKPDTLLGSGGIIQHTKTQITDQAQQFETIGQKIWKYVNDNKQGFDSCEIFGAAIATSNGDNTYMVGMRKGLLGLSPSLSAKAAKELGIQNPNLLDSQTNIKIGSKILNDLRSGSYGYLLDQADVTQEQTPAISDDDLWVVFVDSMSNDRIKLDAIQSSTMPSCNNEKAYLCQDDKSFSLKNSLQVIKLNIDSCNKPEMRTKLEAISSLNLQPTNTLDFWSTPRKIKVTSAAVDIDPQLSSAYTVTVTKNVAQGSNQHTITIKIVKSNRELFTKTFSYSKDQPLNADPVSSKDYPFIRVQLESANMETSEYIFNFFEFKYTVLNTPVAYDPTSFTKTPLWADSYGDVVSATYNNPTKTLTFYTKDNAEFCVIQTQLQFSCPTIPALRIYPFGTANAQSFEGYIQFDPKYVTSET